MRKASSPEFSAQHPPARPVLPHSIHFQSLSKPSGQLQEWCQRTAGTAGTATEGFGHRQPCPFLAEEPPSSASQAVPPIRRKTSAAAAAAALAGGVCSAPGTPGSGIKDGVPFCHGAPPHSHTFTPPVPHLPLSPSDRRKPHTRPKHRGSERAQG